MQILTITLKYIKQNLKRPVTLILLILCPILLILILEQVFAGQFYSGQALPDMHIGYHGEGSVYTVFRSFAQQLSDEGVIFEEEKSRERGEQKTAEGKYNGLVVFNEKGIELLLNSNNGIKSGIIEEIVKSFINRYKLYDVLLSTPGAGKTEWQNKEKKFVSVRALNAPRRPRAIDYISITILTMAILFGSHQGAYGFTQERAMKTLYRIYAAPVKKIEFLSGIFLGIFFTLVIQIAAVFLIGKYFLNIYFGENILPVVALLISECFFAIALGIGITGFIKDNKSALGIMNLILPMLIFLGGGYVKLPDTPVLNILSRISPLTWVNNALLEEIYGGSHTWLLPTVVICLAAGLLILGAAALKIIRRSEI